LCHASAMTDKSLQDTSKVDTAVKELTQFRGHIRHRPGVQNALTSMYLLLAESGQQKAAIRRKGRLGSMRV
jgi:hypothetical protein